MKPLHLELQAFGSFVETADVDFERLDGRKLFLIHGPTGSGKSTLFDAMCYALYGVTSGIRDGKEMRSKQAPDDLETVVRFTFQIGEEKFFVERKPPYIKPGNKNETPHKATFYRLNGREIPAGEPLVKVSEVNERLKSILGFDDKQFVQLIMLPQGEFRRLLLSSTDEREAILARLFKTGLYERISMKLVEKSKEFRKQYEALNQQITTILQSLEVKSREELQDQIQKIRKELKTREEELEGLEKKYREKSAELEKGRQLASAFTEYEFVKTRIEQHQEQKEEIEEVAGQLKKAEDAERFRNPLQEIDKIRQRISAIKDELEKLGNDLEVNEQKRIKVAKQVVELEAQNPDWEKKKTEVIKLQDLKPVLRQKLVLEKSAADLKRIVDDLEQKINELKRSVQSEQQKIESDEEKLPELEKEAGHLSAIEQELEIFQKETGIRVHLKEQNAVLSKKDKEFDAAYDELIKAADGKDHLTKEFQSIDLQWRKNQAAILAKELIEGEACPVCGGTEHPLPAHIPDELVTNEDYDRFKADKEKAEKKYEDARIKFEGIKRDKEKVELQIKSYKDQLEERAGFSELEWQKREEYFRNSFEKASNAEKQLETIRNKKARFLVDQKQNLKKQEELVLKLNSQRTQLDKTTGKLDNMNVALPEDLKSTEILQSKIDLLEKDISEFDKNIKEARENETKIKDKITDLKARNDRGQKYLEEQEQDLKNRQVRIAIETQKAGFKEMDEVIQAMMDEDAKVQLRERKENWNKEEIRLNAEFDRLQKLTKDQTEPDLDLLITTFSEAETKWNEAKEQITRLDTQLHQLEKMMGQIQEAETKRGQIQEKAGEYMDLADKANGKNRYNQKFQTFVLSVFLDEVTQLANERLKIMSQDRYELIRTEDVSHGLRKAGLDLNVFDNYNGEERSVRTLSGGEMFITSLALALGLADVAMQYAGGLKIDAMFIDEGFGSLDTETLDLAVRTLMNLEEDGRLVGIISHVEELKERIDTRLEVIKRQEGSRLMWHIN